MIDSEAIKLVFCIALVVVALAGLGIVIEIGYVENSNSVEVDQILFLLNKDCITSVCSNSM